VSDVEVGASEDWCREHARVVARSFYRGMNLTPADRRAGLFAVYAWMRAADDAADDLSADEALPALTAMRVRTERIFAGRWDGRAASDLAVTPSERGRPAQRFWPAFASAVASFPLRGVWFDDMLDGLESDAVALPGEVRFAHSSALATYRHRVGGVVGLACTALWGVREAGMWGEALHLADARGRAFQLINIARDIGADWKVGRVYVPRSALERHGVSAAMLASWEPSGACAALIRGLVRHARAELVQTWRYERLLAPDCAAAAWALKASYQGIAEVLENDPERAVCGRRARPPKWAKALIAARALTMRPWMVNA